MNKIICISIIIVLLIISIFFGLQFYFNQQQIQKYSAVNLHNSRVIAFDKLFVDKVLRAQGEVSYEDRLKLQNAIVIINDEDLMNHWNRFLGSKTEQEAQMNVLDILGDFPEKIIY